MKKVTAISAIISGTALLIWWWSFLLFPGFRKLFVEFNLFITMEESGINTDYIATVAQPLWVYVNLFMVIAILGGLIFTLFYFKLYIKDESRKEIVMAILLMTGYFIYCGIAFYETFLWPALAKDFPSAISFTGPVYTGKLWLSSNIIGIMAYWIGNLMLGFHFIKNINRTGGLLFAIGVSVICVGYFLSGFIMIRYLIQSIGISLFAFGFIVIGVKIMRSSFAK